MSVQLLRKINQSFDAKFSLLKSKEKINLSIKKIFNSIYNGGKLLICGNGGSSSDAQHLVAEFLVRLKTNVNRKPIPALFLGSDISTITACSNDYDFKYIFSRNLDALANKKDVLIALSTSGNSKNIIEVLKKAKNKKIFSISFLGGNGGLAKKKSDLPIIIESNITAHIQEAHIFLGHYIFEEVEKKLINSKKF